MLTQGLGYSCYSKFSSIVICFLSDPQKGIPKWKGHVYASQTPLPHRFWGPYIWVIDLLWEQSGGYWLSSFCVFIDSISVHKHGKMALSCKDWELPNSPILDQHLGRTWSCKLKFKIIAYLYLMQKKDAKSKEDEQPLQELNSVHRHSQANCQFVQTSYSKWIKFSCLSLLINILFAEQGICVEKSWPRSRFSQQTSCSVNKS